VLDDEIRATIGRTIEAEMLFLLNKTDVGRHQPPALRRRYVDAHVEARQAIARRVREIYRSM
jgi:hypothetical protein